MSTTDTRAAFKAWAEREGYDTAHTHDGIKWLWLNPMTADLSKAYQAATEAAKATGTAGEQWKPKALQGPRKSIFYGGNTNEHLNPLVVLISAEDYEKCCSLCEAPRVPHEMAYTVGGVADVSYVNGWNDCRDTVLGKIDDDPTNAPAEAARQPAPIVEKKLSDTIKPILVPEDFGILDPELAKRAINYANAMVHQSALAATAAPVLSDEQILDIRNRVWQDVKADDEYDSSDIFFARAIAAEARAEKAEQYAQVALGIKDSLEARLAEIQRGVEGLLQYIADHDWGGIPEPVPQIDALRALLQPQGQVTGCTHNCNQGRNCTCDTSGLPG